MFAFCTSLKWDKHGQEDARWEMKLFLYGLVTEQDGTSEF